MLLAWLIPVAGLDGGAEGGADGEPPAPSEGDRPMEGAVSVGSPARELLGKAAADEMLRLGEGGVEGNVGWGMLIGGVFRERGLTGGAYALGKGGTWGAEVEGGGAPVPLVAREGGPFGGGGLGAVALTSAPPFLFTHFFKFSS